MARRVNAAVSRLVDSLEEELALCLILPDEAERREALGDWVAAAREELPHTFGAHSVCEVVDCVEARRQRLLRSLVQDRESLYRQRQRLRSRLDALAGSASSAAAAVLLGLEACEAEAQK